MFVLCLLYSDQNYDPSLSVQASSFLIITLVKIIASRISKKIIKKISMLTRERL